METHRVGRGQELRACGHSAYPRGHALMGASGQTLEW